MYNSTFSNYPLLTPLATTAVAAVAAFARAKEKAADFILFTRIVKLINKKMQLTEEGLLQIINLRASINLGLFNLKKYKFPNYKPVARPVINTTN